LSFGVGSIALRATISERRSLWPATRWNADFWTGGLLRANQTAGSLPTASSSLLPPDQIMLKHVSKTSTQQRC
jgi:hypothetical protein